MQVVKSDSEISKTLICSWWPLIPVLKKLLAKQSDSLFVARVIPNLINTFRGVVQ